MRRFREIKDFGLRRLPTHVSTLQEVEILPTLVYFPLWAKKKGFFVLGSVWGKEKWDFRVPAMFA